MDVSLETAAKPPLLPPTVAVRAWRFRSQPLPEAAGEHAVLDVWRGVAGAVACWPGAPVTVERRWTKGARSPRVVEHLVAASDGAGVLTEHELLLRDLDALCRPLRTARFASPVRGARLERLLDPAGLMDVCELRSLSLIAPEGAGALAGLLHELVEDLAQMRGPALLCLALGTYAPEGGDDEATDELAFGLHPAPLLLMTGRGAGAHRRIRFRLRLAAARPIPHSFLAKAGALVLGPKAVAGRGWHRARGPHQLPAARRALATADLVPWSPPVDEETEDPASPSWAAAMLASLPVQTPALDVSPTPMRALAEPPRAGGALIGRVPLRDGRMAPLRLSWPARRLHTFVVGASGSGKSTLLKRLIAEDLAVGRALVVLDPHGDLADETLGLLSSEQHDRVIVVDPAVKGSATIDLIPSHPTDPAEVVSWLTDAFEELFDPHGRTEWIGPYFKRAISNAVHALLSSQTAPAPLLLTHIDRYVSDGDFRRGVIRGLEPGPVRSHALRDDVDWSNTRDNTNAVSYVTSKLTELTAGRGRSAFDRPAGYSMEGIVTEGRILVCRLPLGELGQQGSRTIGRLVLSRLLAALTAQVARPAHERAEVSLVIDEGHLLVEGRVLEQFLAGARKFGCATTVCCQTPSQTGRALPTVLTNVGTVVSFRLSGREAALFADRAGPSFAETVPRLRPFEAAMVGPMSDVEGLPVVFAGARPLPDDPTARQAARAASAARYGSSHVDDPVGQPDLLDGIDYFALDVAVDHRRRRQAYADARIAKRQELLDLLREILGRQWHDAAVQIVVNRLARWRRTPVHPRLLPAVHHLEDALSPTAATELDALLGEGRLGAAIEYLTRQGLELDEGTSRLPHSTPTVSPTPP